MDWPVQSSMLKCNLSAMYMLHFSSFAHIHTETILKYAIAFDFTLAKNYEV